MYWLAVVGDWCGSPCQAVLSDPDVTASSRRWHTESEPALYTIAEVKEFWVQLAGFFE